MNILLTGGAGYIGTHIAAELLHAGDSIVIADNFSNSDHKAIRRLQSLTNCDFPVRNSDFTVHSQVIELFNDFQFDAVIHLAGFKAVGESALFPLRYYRNNVTAAITLLEAMLQYSVPVLIFSSSATVYGTPEYSPVPESAHAGHCFNPYGRSKFMVEQIIADTVAANPELSAVILRYFNPIGAHPSGLLGENPESTPNNLMPRLIRVAAGIDDKLTVYGDDYNTKDGTGVRDYLHISDLARAHLAALRFAALHNGIEFFNLGTGIGYSVFDIINTFSAVNNIPIDFVISPRRPGDIDEYFADPSKALRLLDWKALKTLEDMCRDSWRWFLNFSASSSQK